MSDTVRETSAGPDDLVDADGESAEPVDRRLGAPLVVSSPSRSDPVARVASAIIGGSAGRRLRPGRGFWTALPMLVLLAALTTSLGVVQKAHCVTQGWSSPDQFWHACYSDIPVLYGSAGLGATDRPSLFEAIGSQGLGQPPLAGAAMWVVSGLVDADPAGTAPRRFFLVSAVLLGAVLMGAVTAVALAAGRRRRWDAAHLALAPALLTAGLISYDLLAVGFLAAAFYAWSRRRPAAAGVLLGLGVLCRPQVAMVLVALLGVCLRSGRWRAWNVAAASTFAVWLAARVVLFPSPLGSLGDTWEAWKSSTPGYGSLWLVPQLLGQSRPRSARFWYTGPAFNAVATTTGTLLGLLLVALAVLLLALSSRYRPRVAHLALVAMCGTLLVTKALPPQTPLLLVPLIALCGLRWRDHLIWAGTEIAYFVGVWLYIAAGSDANRGLPAGLYLVLLLARAAGITWLGFQAGRAALDPTRDPVRVPVDPVEGYEGEDDPAGGVVDGAPDALIVRLA